MYIYLITRCDHAGIIDLNIELAEFQTKIKGLAKSMATVRQELRERFVHLRDNYYIMPKFIAFQYPKGLNSNVKPQLAVINRLAEFGLDSNSYLRVSEELANSYLTVQDKDKDTDKDKDKEKDKSLKVSQEDVIQYFVDNGYTKESAVKAFDYYDCANWRDSKGNQVKNWKQKMRGVWFKDENKAQSKDLKKWNPF